MERATGAVGDGPRAPGPGGRPPRGGVVVGLVAVAVLASAAAGPWRPAFREADEPLDAPPPPPPVPEANITVVDEWYEALESMEIEPWDLRWLGILLFAALTAAALWAVVRWLRRRPPPRIEGAPEPGDVVQGDLVSRTPGVGPHTGTLNEGLDGAAEQLRVTLDPTDAVIAAWVQLEEAAGRSGVERHPAWTPTEFTVTVLDRTPADRAATRTLLDLYLRARFGHERMTADDVAAAARAVAALAETLRGEDLEGPVDAGAGDVDDADDGDAREDAA